MTHSPNDGSPEELNRDALLLRLLNTPPQPRDERKRPRAKAGKEPSRGRNRTRPSSYEHSRQGACIRPSNG